jgi:hypothetical protein
MEAKLFLTVQVNYKKTDIPLDEICYISVEGRKTKITMRDGGFYLTNKKMKDIYAVLPEKAFDNINRGIIVAQRYVKDVEDGVYTMSDGAQFRHRVRKSKIPKKHKVLNEEIIAGFSPVPREFIKEAHLWIEKMPVAFCIIELTFHNNGSGIDFILRYSNHALADLMDMKLDEMHGKPFYSIFKKSDRKWLVTYSDIALNGGTHIIEGYSLEIKKNMKIYCFQPKQGFCACLFTEIANSNESKSFIFNSNVL